MKILNGFIFFLFTGILSYGQVQSNRSLTLNSDDLKMMENYLGDVPIFDNSFDKIRSEIDEILTETIEVPIPKDLAGGYSHERHKSNYHQAHQAGLLYQITGQVKYAGFVKEMLGKYADLYPNLPLHPEERSYSRGKIFWQALNDANWLVYMSQAYGSIHHYLTEDERSKLEKNLFRPFADFLSIENPQFFNRIHNHSTWGNAAVGMIGLVMKDDELIDRALFGLKDDKKIDYTAKDNDGGFIVRPGQNAGYLANVVQAFSPSGYYTEGPYYQRYAMYPFLIFAVAIENQRPDLEIFKFKDGVLLKAVSTLINLSDNKGEFFTLNDAQKGMSLQSRELVSAVSIAYYFGEKDPALLSIIKDQGRVNLDQAGFASALALSNGKATSFEKVTQHFTDGPSGENGGLSVLRYKGEKDSVALVFKYTSHGDSHGHFDKLSYNLHINQNEILQDYGLVRFVNVVAKNGGGYLKENSSWAKQSIAHNTVVQDEVSHFNGDFETGSKYHSELFFTDSIGDSLQIISAKDFNAYENTELHRTLILMEKSEKPLLVDVFRIKGKGTHQYDFPYHYFGQIINTSFKIQTPLELKKLGEKSGYQHLYKEGESLDTSNYSKFTWLHRQKFYTLSTTSNQKHKVIFARLGANDPDFNLRRDPSIIYRIKDADQPLLISVLEAHGTYDPVTEKAENANSTIENIKLLVNNDLYTAFQIDFKVGKNLMVIIVNSEKEEKEHFLQIADKSYQWKGSYYIK